MTATGEPVAVLGVGTMGHGMADSALRAGIPTIVWDRHPEATRELADRGAEVAQTAADAARRAGIVITMVPDADAVISIARDQGMLAALAPDAVWVQMSTIGLAGINEVMAMVVRDRPDVVLLDAPVSGSKDPAEQGQLIIFASGPQDARPRVTPLFDALGHRHVWVGPAGTGTRLKLVNNTWLAFGAEAVAASVALAHRLGLATETVIDALSGGPIVSPWQAAKLQRIATGDFSAQFALSLALKDVHLALQEAGADQLAVLACLADEWQRVVDDGLGDQDLTVVTRVLEQQAASGRSVPGLATVADVMRPALTTVEANGHLAAAAYLMKHAGETALLVIDEEHAKQPVGLITDADIARVVADREDPNQVRIHDLMTTDPTVVSPMTSIDDAARVMVAGHFRHLPVVGDAGLVGIVDIGDVCGALLDSPAG
jgi:3-hydroxyisobutyrate dehydrogenase